MHHRTGRKSFAVIADNEAESSGPPPSRLKMFELAYGKGDSSYKAGFTQQKSDEINGLRAAREQGSNSFTDEEIFLQVFGDERPGRVRCMGPGHTPTSRWGRRPTRVDFDRDREERRKQHEEIARRFEMTDVHQAQLEARLEEERQRDRGQLEAHFEARLEERQRDRRQLEARLEEERQRDRGQLQEQFEERIRQMQAGHEEQMRRMMDEFSRRIMQQPPS